MSVSTWWRYPRLPRVPRVPRVRFGPGQREGSHQQPSAATATEQAAGRLAMDGMDGMDGHADGEVTRDLAMGKMVV
jgi:hypothetical protein